MIYAILLLFFTAAAICYLMTFRVRRLAIRIGCMDRPDDRKLHGRDTPRLGGLAIILGFAIPLLLATLHPVPHALAKKNLDYLFALLSSGSLIVALGVYDDLYGSNAPKKFIVQILCGVLLVAFGFHFDVVSIPFTGQTISLGIFGALFSILWTVGVINAVNFIDGMDSLLASVAATIAVAFGAIAMIRGDVVSLVIMTALAGSLTGFLPWNRSPAKIFMGDTGSMFLGLLLAACSIARESKTPTALAVAGPMLALGLPVIDTLLVMKKRFQEKQPTVGSRISRMFNADRTHMHHILVSKYGSQPRAIFSIWIITVLFGAAAVVSVLPGMRIWGYALGAFTLLLMLFLRFNRGVADFGVVDPLPGEPLAPERLP